MIEKATLLAPHFDRDKICLRLQTAILSLCKETYSAENGLEVDGIICISILNTQEQHVVKIHKQLHDTELNSDTVTYKDKISGFTRGFKTRSREKDVSGTTTGTEASDPDEVSDYGSIQIRMCDGQMFASSKKDESRTQCLAHGSDDTGAGDGSENIFTAQEERIHDTPRLTDSGQVELYDSDTRADNLPQGRSASGISHSDDSCVVIKVEPDEMDNSNGEQQDDVQTDGDHQMENAMEQSSDQCNTNINSKEPDYTDQYNKEPVYTGPYNKETDYTNHRNKETDYRDHCNKETDYTCTAGIASQLHNASRAPVFPPRSFVKTVKPESKYRNCSNPRYKDGEEYPDMSFKTEQLDSEKHDIKPSANTDKCQENLLGCLPSLSFQELFPGHTSQGISTASISSQRHDGRKLSQKAPRKRYSSKWSAADRMDTYYTSDTFAGDFHHDLSKNKWYFGPDTAESNFYSGSVSLSPSRISSTFTSDPVTPKSMTKSPTSGILRHKSKLEVNGQQREKKYFCHYCGAGFTMQCTKIRHEKTTCGISKYACTVCKKVFSRSDSKVRHMLKAHGLKIVL